MILDGLRGKQTPVKTIEGRKTEYSFRDDLSVQTQNDFDYFSIDSERTPRDRSQRKL